MPTGGSVLRVTYQSIDDCASRCDKALSDLNSEISTMDSQVNSLAAAGWHGVAATSFESAEKTWRTAAMDLAQVLTSVSSALHQSSAAYRSTEAGNASRFA